MKKTIILLTALTVLGKALGIVRESVLASFWGTSYIVDAYLTAGAIGGIVFGWLLSVYVCYTPVYIQLCSSKSPEEGRKFTGNLIGLMAVVYTVLAVFLYLFRTQFIHIIVPGYSPEAKAMATFFLAIAAPGIVVVPIINLLKAYLDANRHFICSIATDSLFSLFQIGMIIMGGLLGIKFLAGALIIPFIFQFMIIIIILKKLRMTFPVRIQYTGEVRRILHLLMPVCLSSLMTEINSFVDKLFASSLQEGSVAILNYGFSLREAIMNVVMYAFVTISFPILSRYVAEQNRKKLKDMIQNSLQMISVIFIPLTVGTILLSRNVIRLVYERGNFGETAVFSTQEVLNLYLLAIVPIVIRTYLLKVFYAFQETKIAMVTGVVSTAANVVLNGLLVGPLGRSGLVAATILSDLIVLPLLFAALNKKIPDLNGRKQLIVFFKCIAAALIMGAGISYVSSRLPADTKAWMIGSSLICFFTGVVLYYAAARILKIEEAEQIGDWIKIKARGMKR